ncbi:LamG-like jellyroll fold domain-containing protein [Aquimarina sp. RZ0]|uniref:LamG-like jellyroll fold domain-containing protein n=1 Tax=Aquimarina sp. RZ0 TaxID=2607730 RepID=UPI0011F1B315|nr:LamG-like jellyroll fold domain-containing protein [Aquimarina sp. RZ0]KAA1244467.1 LamG domain-containing protein [Aquimarina sp. RZ0]
MKLNRIPNFFSIISLLILHLSCGSNHPEKLDLKNALTLYASFDVGVKADFALGDANLYTVPSREARDSIKVGLHKKDVTIAKGKGLYGDALYYGSRSKGYIYYTSKDNIAYNTDRWNGSVSFWLNLDPATDLEPGYCDPIQITDVSYNDASIWVDFTKENPRDFRLGVIGDKESWKKNTEIKDNDDDDFVNQLVPVSNPPFAKGTWTHIFINFKGLNTKQGEASFYINGELKGKRTDIIDPFTWELEKSNIYLGLGYIGLMDELSIFNRNLTHQEITALYSLENGVHSLLK